MIGEQTMSKPKYYVLDGKTPVGVNDVIEWAKAFENSKRRVAEDFFGENEGKDFVEKVRVSTVFLGLDHDWTGNNPQLFESMVFGGELDGEMDRYATWDEAEAGHKALVEKVRRTAK